MGDIFHDEIKSDKEEIINHIKEFCNIFGLEVPELDTRMRIDVLETKSKEIRKLIFKD